MAREEYILDQYLFLEKEEYERARKEEETMEYLMANIDGDKKELLKIYNRAVEKKSFQTVIGLRCLYDLRCRLIESGIVSEDILAPIPVGAEAVSEDGTASENKASGQVKHYKELYEDAMAVGRVKNMVIGVLVFMVLGMIVISAI